VLVEIDHRNGADQSYRIGQLDGWLAENASKAATRIHCQRRRSRAAARIQVNISNAGLAGWRELVKYSEDCVAFGPGLR
jgi:hypothetical protein